MQDLSDYSRINPLTTTPPWCLTLLVSGHTFNRDFGTLISEYVRINCGVMMSILSNSLGHPLTLKMLYFLQQWLDNQYINLLLSEILELNQLYLILKKMETSK